MTALSLPLAARSTPRRPAADLDHRLRTLLAAVAVTVLLAILYALGRALTGSAPAGGALKEVALAIHLATVVPAIPLGAYVLLTRKGTARHRRLGKLWLVLMIVAAVSAFWIRHLNNGGFSAIHLLIPVVLVASWRVVATARRGDIVAHRRVLLSLFVGGLLIPALVSFAPGRLMMLWLVG